MNEWKQDVLSVVNIKVITFRDCIGYPMDKAFWDGTTDFFKSLRARDGWSPSSPKICFAMMSKPQFAFGNDIPITTLGLQYEEYSPNMQGSLFDGPGVIEEPARVSIDTRMFPTSLVNLNVHRDYHFKPRFDLSYLSSLKQLYIKNNDNLVFDPSTLPLSLTRIQIGYGADQDLTNVPANVIDVAVYSPLYPYPIQQQHIQHLTISSLRYSLPAQRPFMNLRHLYTQSIDNEELINITSESFPMLETLVTALGNQYTETTLFDLSKLPSSLNRLEISPHRPIKSLPSGVVDLHIVFNQCETDFELSNIWSNSPLINNLTLDTYRLELKVGDIPSSVTKLKLLDYGKSLDIANVLPGTLRSLTWIGGTDHDIRYFLQHLPTNIVRLDIKIGEEKFNLSRLSDTLFLQLDYDLRYGLITIDKLQSL
ncbi:hypothetical protein SAMD00019534_026400 [Acytostelium subglobosum LB1]|uniref:hypothetical protein n=1 Tax=Acytostelium subglobosum LB1 TaxID=1410327 RepID=UPI0006447C6E|nr:hypothetical protein SAMD00019534_026400 [Acytostelium subglobosum LB1]GAM19465.1 hypothetical protein SAMD00019534_026400 [Acytostelium subglobosum LB1]|eukprot:XP_012757392.1 hypothetical protein SAMD00019534_026400 [Acytostelium subglobosum LB1]